MVAEKGRVYLAGAGPGDPELLTVRTLRLLQSADTILHDDLVPQAILDLAGRTALVISVGKRCGAKRITQVQIHAMMIESARKGLSVVRLKSGDPLIFGRAAEEIDALSGAGIPFEVVPGVTAAFAAAAALGISLTDRRASSGVQFSTAHHAAGSDGRKVFSAESFEATQVIYMPGRSFQVLAEEWLKAGVPGELPCCVISRAAQPDQTVQHTHLSLLGELVPTTSPSLLLAGWALLSGRENRSSRAGEWDVVDPDDSQPDSVFEVDGA